MISNMCLIVMYVLLIFGVACLLSLIKFAHYKNKQLHKNCQTDKKKKKEKWQCLITTFYVPLDFELN